MGAVPAVAVLYTRSDVAGNVIGPAAFVAVRETRGMSKPLVVLTISSIALAAGAAPVALIPTFCALIKLE